ncbi:MAG: hypothetical protein KatS3mg108_3197 [Isosphaeraceae bacterium]|nr:MAG: hypothetical protein KatS3mg108_3197 [Isosphaeraceae bacterium]
MSVTARRVAWQTPHGGMPSGGLESWSRQWDPERVLVLVPTATSRELWQVELARRSGEGRIPRVRSWPDLWTEIRAEATIGPRVLGAAGQRLILERAIETCVREGRFAEAGDLVRTGGFRRWLGSKLETWSRSWERGSTEPPSGATEDQWAVFCEVRRLKAQAGVSDEAGLERWASRPGRVRRYLRRSGVAAAAVADVTRLGRGGWRVLRTLCEELEAIVVSVAGEAEPGRELLSQGLEPIWERLRLLGFELVPGPEEQRPAGLDAVRRSLFRVGAGLAEGGQGVRVEAMPEGVGEALGAARAVRQALATGASPDDVVVLVPHWSELASLASTVLREWGIGCSGGPPVPLARDPGVACVLAVASLPRERWEARRVASVLRHGRLAPKWAAPQDSETLAQAARALIECRGFRDIERLLAALERCGRSPEGVQRARQAEERARVRARLGFAVLSELGRLFGDEPMNWGDCVARLDRIIEGLGLSETDDTEAVEVLRATVAEQGRLLTAIGDSDEAWTWDRFVGELRGIAQELTLPAEPYREGTVRISTVEEAWGAEVGWRVVVGASEKTFPTPQVVRSTWSEPEGDGAWLEELTLAREMRRFLDLAASTRNGLTIVHGSTDEKGQPLLRAGFVDELVGLFSAGAQRSVVGELRVLRPVLEGTLAYGAREQRVIGLAEALEGSPGRIVRLARRADQAEALEGVATALRVIHFRSRERFSHYDGVIGGDRTIREIAREFDERAAALSPSQLETYALCPFRYYLRYVVGVETCEVEELREDLTERGRRLHRVLERFHRRLRAEGTGIELERDRLLGWIVELIEEQVAEGERVAGEFEESLRALDRQRLEECCRSYVEQWFHYSEKDPRAVPHAFELAFGRDVGLPPLRLGPDRLGRTILLQGVVDRLDLIEGVERSYFRVIDYKSGKVPTARDLRAGRALQLPLYALAVERLAFGDGSVVPAELGYWGLKKGGGYRRLYPEGRRQVSISEAAEGWAGFAERLERFVFDLVDRIRSGEFPVAPSIEECERNCEYRTACRIRQLGQRDKSWERRPSWEPKPEQPS